MHLQLLVWLFLHLLWDQVMGVNRLLDFRTMEDFLDTCLDGQYHKKKPGPEIDLYKQCLPWKDRACCLGNTTEAFHHLDRWQGFQWDHCPGHKMSDKCKKHFIQDLCFYECSPNLGPWLVQISRRLSNERAVYVPLCQSDCEAWWEDCKRDYTCRDNWAMGFNWSTGTNKCPAGSVCKTIEEHFGTSKKFCEQVWDHSWEVVADSEPCMNVRFLEGANPNDKIAHKKAQFIVNSLNSSQKYDSNYATLTVTVLVALLMTYFVR